ncbi:MAG TPA: nickel-dependent hydrogenase large subunit [Magnetospirillum sp.]|jgi:hypothetical protein|nr:nickel-dependent hydrogenase large subunit [Magnetospirillum sp.]
MFPEARLDVTLRTHGGAVQGVVVRSTRLVQASRLFAGRRPHDVTQLLPTVFALCGTAQVLASLGALEQAAGQPLSTAQGPARHLLLLGEIVSEHSLALARDWPELAGLAPDLGMVRRLKLALGGLRATLYPAGDWNRPGGGVLHPDHAALRAAFAEARSALDQLLDAPLAAVTSDLYAYQAWIAASPSPVAQLLKQVSSDELAAFGRGPFQPMPEQGPADLSARLETDREGLYVAQPDSAGRVFETGPLARMAWHPVVAGLIGRFGPGLLARLSARLVEVASSLQEMEDLVQDLDNDQGAAACLVDGVGLGLVEAARGLLAHRVELEGGKVTRYQILAPTEWNFHPEGPLARGQAGAPVTDDLLRRATLLAHALDPCVACDIKVENA